MKVLLFNTNNSAGGASKACYRYHTALQEYGISSRLLINEPPPHVLKNAAYFYEGYKNVVQQRSFLKKLKDKILSFRKGYSYADYISDLSFQKRILRQRNNSLEVFTFHNSFFDITLHPWYQDADIIHLHFVANHFFDFSMFKKIDKPIVWTLHDMNPFTGGCHYSEGCNRFKDNCTPCPQLQNTEDENYAGKMLARHIHYMNRVPEQQFFVVSPSHWLCQLSSSSTLFKRFKHFRVPYGVDNKTFHYQRQDVLRKKYDILTKKKVFLFVAYRVSNKRKGFDLLINALNKLENTEDILLLTVGKDTGSEYAGINTIPMGMITSEQKMSELYSLADVFIIPSLEDNLPNTVIESLMCGTPVIGFPTGGIVDMVQSGKNGFLSKEITAESLSATMQQFLKDPHLLHNRQQIAEAAALLYSEKKQVETYLEIYREALSEYV